MIRNILKNKVIKNISWIVIERLAQMLITLIVGSLTVRFLGPQNYGLINYGLSIVTFFMSLAKLGLDGVIVKQYIEHKDNDGDIVGTALFMRIISGLISILLILLVINILKPDDNLVKIITFLQSISLIFQSYEILDFWFQSKLKSKYTSIAKIIAYVIVSSYKIFLLVTHKTVIWFAFSNTIDYLLIFIILLIMYKKNGGKKFQFSLKKGHELLMGSYHFIISGLMVTLYMQMDKIMIGSMINDFELGIYSAATSICGIIAFIPEAIINSFRSIIYDSKRNNELDYINKLKILYFLVFWIGICFGIFVLFFSKYIILILYGKTYLSAQKSLIIAVWYTSFAYLGSARNVWLISENKSKYARRFVTIGAVVNLVLNFILIPIYGINGAAVATLISQISVSLIAPLLFKETKISTKYMLEGIILKGVKLDNYKNIG